MRNLFEKRDSFKPFEYPEIIPFKEAIQHNYWLFSEFNYISDIQDFHTKLNDIERNTIKNALLAISQIEVSVKKFWANLGTRFPKAEFDQVGVVFANSEVIHSDAYSHLLHVLGLNDDFSLLLQNPVIKGRVEYLTKYLKGASSNSNEGFALSLTLFSLFIENVSLFSQFLVVKAFNKYKNILKDIDNVISATRQEELIHSEFGIYLIKLLKEENPEWFNDHFYDKIHRASIKAYEAEEKIIDWIFEAGDLEFLTKETTKEFIKDRFNKSVMAIGGKQVFDIDKSLVDKVKWFDEEGDAVVNIDFFNKKSTNYSKNTKPITENDLF